MSDERIACRTPTEGRDGVSNIPKWKFDMLRFAIKTVLANGPVKFSELKDRVRPLLSEQQLSDLGALGWHVTTVKLELEVREDIRRLPVKGAQQIEWVG